VYPRKSKHSSGSDTSRVFSSFTVNPSRAINCRTTVSTAAPLPGGQQITKSSA
jgi:hypothetical protein